jgi:hypothetical protein
MYIGEDHTDNRTMVKFLEEWPAISAQIDMLFLESFHAGLTPPTHRQAIKEVWERDMGVKQWEWEYSNPPEYPGRAWTPRAYSALMHLAARSGTPVRGIDLWPHPVLTRLRGQALAEAAAFRTSPELHRAWATCIRMNLRGTRYAIYGGAAHGIYLRRYSLPNLACFALDPATDRFREYTFISGRSIAYSD